MEIPFYAENYEENDGTIASSPNLQKVVVFYEIQFKKKMLCGLGFAGIDFGDKTTSKNVTNSKKRPPPRLRLMPWAIFQGRATTNDREKKQSPKTVKNNLKQPKNNQKVQKNNEQTIKSNQK